MVNVYENDNVVAILNEKVIWKENVYVDVLVAIENSNDHLENVVNENDNDVLVEIWMVKEKHDQGLDNDDDCCYDRVMESVACEKEAAQVNFLAVSIWRSS